jgi:hypothetical protein
MLGFSRLRNKYKGPVNKLAYLGMAGDVVVAVGLYVLWRERKRRQEAALPGKIKAQIEENLQLYPPKVKEIEYNRFSPYTPVPYHNDNFTKFQHHHIDLVGYLNEKQNNPTNYYYARYNDYTATDADVNRLMDWHNPYDVLGGHHHHNQGSHSHHA